MIHLTVSTDMFVEGVVVKSEGKRAIGFRSSPEGEGGGLSVHVSG